MLTARELPFKAGLLPVVAPHNDTKAANIAGLC
jgi:hypothetical protein